MLHDESVTMTLHHIPNSVIISNIYSPDGDTGVLLSAADEGGGGAAVGTHQALGGCWGGVAGSLVASKTILYFYFSSFRSN